jgi:hypothetical protein
MEPCYDKNSKGLGLLLRVAGAIVPFGAAWGLAVALHWSEPGLPAALAWPLRVIAFLWAWPSAGYYRLPLFFGAIAILTIGFMVILFRRHDRRGSLTVLVWSLFWAWFGAMVSGWTD